MAFGQASIIITVVSLNIWSTYADYKCSLTLPKITINSGSKKTVNAHFDWVVVSFPERSSPSCGFFSTLSTAESE